MCFFITAKNILCSYFKKEINILIITISKNVAFNLNTKVAIKVKCIVQYNMKT